MIETERFKEWSAQQLFVALVPAVFMFAVTLFAPSLIPDGDPFWHITAGEWILTHGTVPTTDPFSHTFQGAPWTAHEWLSEVLYASAYLLGGWGGVRVLVGLAGLATTFLMARELLKHFNPVPALIVLMIVVANLAIAADARPQFLAFPIMVAWLSELLAARRQGRAPGWILLPLMVVWANLHGSFIFGLALIGPFALEALINGWRNWRAVVRDWALVSLGAVLAALVNPTGIWGLLFPFHLMSLSALSFIAEWTRYSFGSLEPFEVTLLFALFFCLLRGVRIPTIRLLLLLGLLHMALQRQRFSTVLILAGALILAEPIAAMLKARIKREPRSPALPLKASAVAAAFVLCFSALRLAIPIVITNDHLTPIAALASVPDNILNKPVFNDYEFGGYLIFKGIRPFIDGRADMYGDEFMRNYVGLHELDNDTINAWLNKYGVVWAIVHSDHRRGRIFDRPLPGWRMHYHDEFASIYLRDDPLAASTAGQPSL
jgi:hypothetical protein